LLAEIWLGYLVDPPFMQNRSDMNINDMATNKGKRLKGNIEESVGRALHDDDLIVAGKANQASSDLKEAGEKVKDAAKSFHKR
jgi:uncharacterized protein YjbJ (UPF0337 family)